MTRALCHRALCVALAACMLALLWGALAITGD